MYVFYKSENIKLQAFSKKFTEIPQRTVYKDNHACFKVITLPKILPRTKYTASLYHFF